MTNKEKLIEFILKLSNEEAERILSNLMGEIKKEKTCERAASGYHKTIYSIKHNVTGREYIGITHNFEERIKAHLCSLRGGRHNIEDMQSDFDKYGEDFTFTVLEEITDYSKRCREYDWMESHKSYIRGKGYNYKDVIFKKKKGVAYATKRQLQTTDNH